MKKTNTLYWITTGLFAAFMTFSAIPDILSTQEAVTFITALGYPKYLIPFLGVAKLLGAIAILIPGFPRLKEWAYAGLCYDLLGATYSAICVDGPMVGQLFMVLPLGMLALSYIYHHRRERAST